MRRFLIVAAAVLFFAGQAFGKPTGVPLNLAEMARLKFPAPPLSEAEERVVQHALDGTVADCSNLGGGDDPAKPEKWHASRNVRADLIRWLVVDREARKQVDPRGVQIQGARITGDLDLSSTNIPFPLFLWDCRLDWPLKLQWAKVPVLGLDGSWIQEINAEGLKLEGSLFLGTGFHAERGVQLYGATIGGDLDAERGTFKNPNGNALYANSIKVTGSVFLRSGFHAEGGVQLYGATIGGDLDAERGTFKNPNENALYANGIKVNGNVFLRSGFSAEGGVQLLGATIGGDLDAERGSFKNRNPKGFALNGERAKVTGDVFLDQGFNAEGGVQLYGATIGGDLNANGGTFKSRNPKEEALAAGRARVTGDVLLDQGFNAEGGVQLYGATIGGNLDAERGTFKNPKGYALYADGIKVAGSVFLRSGFHAEGGVWLLGATIGSDLDAHGGTFKSRNPKEDALDAERAKVTGDVFLDQGFNAEGEVRLPGATIGGNLEADGGTFKKPSGNALNPDGTKNETALSADGINVSGDVFLSDDFVAEGEVRLLGAEVKGQLEVDHAWLDALNLKSAHVTGPFLWQNIHRDHKDHKDRHPDFPNKEWKPSLDLTNAKVGPLADQEASWPEEGRLRLDGFVYGRILARPIDAEATEPRVPIDATARLDWLHRQPDELGYLPQPYEQLIAVLRQMGHEDQVAKVAIAKQKDLRKRGDLGRWGKFWNRFLYRTVRSGYEPWRAFMWLALLVITGTLVFLRARLRSVPVMVPSDKEAYQSDGKAEKAPLPHYYPKFNALVYSLDVIFPFDLGQKSHWRLSEKPSGAVVYWIYEGYSLVQLIFGWILLLVAAAVPAGLIK
jgi:hypothetical protein